MSMTGQKTRTNPKQEVKNLVKAGNWNKTFPAKMETDTMSCVFVKKLLTISKISYLMSMFPENAYSNRSMDGLPLKILMEKNKCKPAAVLASWLVGAFDAKRRRLSSEQVIGLDLLVRELQVPVDGGCEETKISWLQLVSAFVFRYT